MTRQEISYSLDIVMIRHGTRMEIGWLGFPSPSCPAKLSKSAGDGWSSAKLRLLMLVLPSFDAAGGSGGAYDSSFVYAKAL